MSKLNDLITKYEFEIFNKNVDNLCEWILGNIDIGGVIVGDVYYILDQVIAHCTSKKVLLFSELFFLCYLTKKYKKYVNIVIIPIYKNDELKIVGHNFDLLIVLSNTMLLETRKPLFMLNYKQINFKLVKNRKYLKKYGIILHKSNTARLNIFEKVVGLFSKNIVIHSSDKTNRTCHLCLNDNNNLLYLTRCNHNVCGECYVTKKIKSDSKKCVVCKLTHKMGIYLNCVGDILDYDLDGLMRTLTKKYNYVIIIADNFSIKFYSKKLKLVGINDAGYFLMLLQSQLRLDDTINVCFVVISNEALGVLSDLMTIPKDFDVYNLKLV